MSPTVERLIPGFFICLLAIGFRFPRNELDAKTNALSGQSQTLRCILKVGVIAAVLYSCYLANSTKAAADITWLIAMILWGIFDVTAHYRWRQLAQTSNNIIFQLPAPDLDRTSLKGITIYWILISISGSGFDWIRFSIGGLFLVYLHVLESLRGQRFSFFRSDGIIDFKGQFVRWESVENWNWGQKQLLTLQLAPSGGTVNSLVILVPDQFKQSVEALLSQYVPIPRAEFRTSIWNRPIRWPFEKRTATE